MRPSSPLVALAFTVGAGCCVAAVFKAGCLCLCRRQSS